MSPSPWLTRMKTLFLVLVALLMISSVASAQNNASNNYMQLVCPANSAVTPGATIDVPVYIVNSVQLGGLSYGFKYNSDFVEIDTVIAGPATQVPGGFGQFLQTKNTAANTVLVGWINFTPFSPMPVHAPGSNALAFTLRFKIQPSATNGCINIDSTFVPPAGFITFSPQTSSDIITAVGYQDCTDKDIILGDGCDTPPPPIANCQSVTVSAGVSCTAAADINNGSSDPGGRPITLSYQPVGPYPLGTTNVRLIVTNDLGAADTCFADVTVVDDTDPVVTCPANITVGNDAGMCGAVVNFTPTATDNCGNTTIVSNPASGSLFATGTTQVRVIASDAAGNADTCFFNVTVNDTEAPVATCHGDTTVNVGVGVTSAVVTFSSSVTDNCEGATIVCIPASGSTFNLGSTLVTCVGTDLAGNADTCSFTVTVVGPGNQPPVVGDIPDQSIIAGGSFTPIDLDDYVTDPDDADFLLDWTFSGNTLLTVVIDDTSHIAIVSYPGGFTGSETITFTATDPGALFDSDAATFTVTAAAEPDFTLNATPGNVTVPSGVASPFQYTVDVDSVNGFSNTVDLTVAGLPAGATADFTPNPVSVPGSSTLSGMTSASTPAGVYQLVIVGDETGVGGIVHADTVTLTVGECSAPPVCQLDVDSLNVAAEEGASPADETIYVTNVAPCGTLFWEATTDVDWISLDPTSGDIDAHQLPGDPITLSFNTAALAPGDYVGHVHVSPVVLAGKVAADENCVLTVYLTIFESPVSLDSVWVSDETAYPGDDVPVELNFYNVEALAGMSAGLTWNSEDVTLDSVSYVGSRVDYIMSKITTINNTENTVALGVLRIPPESLVAPGSGLWATLWFSVDASAMPQVVTIDTVFIQPGVELLFNDELANSIYPQFNDGSINILERPYTCITGTVTNEGGDPVEGATVELWDMTSVVMTTTTNASGYYKFCFEGSLTDEYTVRAYAPGYYPGQQDGVNLGDENVDIVLPNTLGPVTPTNEWVNLYCEDAAMLDEFTQVPVGSVLEAVDPDGVVAGRWVFSEAGTFGFMPVYRDDIYTPSVDEGFEPGDEITLLLNGEEVDLTSSSPLTWTGNGDSFEACFEGFIDQEVTQCIQLNAGWNLISFNVVLPTNDLETLFADVLDNTDVILSFENEGLTYDPSLPEFSTLFTVDNYHGYWFRMNSDDSICVTGMPVNPSTPIDLEFNWNLVSYLPQDPMPVEDALASIWDCVVVVLGYNGGALTYDPDFPELSTLEMMEPGFGYWIKTDCATTLVYPNGDPVAVVSNQGTRTLNSVVPRVKTSNTWVNLYGSNVTLNGQRMAVGTTIEAYNEAGNLVGEFKLSQNGKFGFMPVYGQDAYDVNNTAATGSKITFKVNGEDANETITWTNNGDRIQVSGFTTLGKNGTLPTEFSLAQNYPNPFNPETSIGYVVANAAQVEVAIYNVMGAKVKTLVSEFQPAGTYTVKWYGDSDNGQKVASGVYFYKMSAGDFSEVKKMTLLK